MGTKYGYNDVIIKDLDNENSPVPQFLLIQKVLFSEPNIFFTCSKIKAHKYHESSRSYCVSVNYSEGFVIVAFDELFDFHPISLHKCAVVDCFFEHVVLRQAMKYKNYASNFKFY